ncbi:hypothetical protein OPV22_019630 [Ensete ventricosum]|uniref:GDP-D-glucose phosphorylase 1 n=1 Tax=Ensete ventricosum TaxID=4639 RepID=A0AAV8QN72_ENSVE|nr:hypothetical protein OPV22_019630 [Ensete ventricosum]
MLTIKRVPTVLSNYQEDSGEPCGCDRNCLGKCCLPVSKLPLYAFESEARHKISSSGDDEPPSDFFLNTLLLGQWEDRMSRGLFRYDVMACESKVGQEEVLFRFEPRESGSGRLLEDDTVGDANASNVVAFNASPIEYGYVLLIPRVLDCLPQRIDLDSFLLALHMAAEAGSLTLGSGTTAWVPLPPSITCISRLISYPCLFLWRKLPLKGYLLLKDLSIVVANSCICLQENNIPFNVLISDSGRRIFLFPQCYAEKQALGEVSQDLLDTQVNPAVWEISGHIVLKWKKDYDKASEYYAWKLVAEVSLSEARFAEVKAYIFEATGLVESEEEKMEPEDRKGAPYQSPNRSGHCYSSPQDLTLFPSAMALMETMFGPS